MVKVLENISLKPYNTFGIDQSTKYFTEVHSEQELLELLQNQQWKTTPKLILGGGSNMLLCNDFEGMVIKIALKGLQATISGSEVLVKASAGEVWHDFVLHCVRNGWSGIENLSLIPGCVGAAPIQNIGAYGVEVKDVITEVRALNIKTLSVKSFSNADCMFGYRESVFKSTYKDQFIVLSVTFKLSTEVKINSSYGAIGDVLKAKNISSPSIKDISDAVIEIRSSKLPDPKEIGNAGSFFKNPEIDTHLYEKIKTSYPEIPSYPTGTNLVKIPAGWLIEKAGWKGKTLGSYGVHKNQALVLVNYGGAKGKEIKQLASDIQADVFAKFGVVLHNEVNYIESQSI